MCRCLTALTPTEFSSQLGSSMIKMLNMGLYTDMDSKLVYHTRDWPLTVLYQIYMFTIQIILLNMLIALMNSTHTELKMKEEVLWLKSMAQQLQGMDRIFIPVLTFFQRLCSCLCNFFACTHRRKPPAAASEVRLL